MAYEKMPCLYESEADLVNRLGGTICRYKGEPVMVSVQNERSLRLTDVVTGKEVATVRPNNAEFDISSPEIGYMNFEPTKEALQYAPNVKSKVIYLARNTARRYRQGLYTECIYSYSINGESNGVHTQYILSSRGFVDSIMGSFPSWRTALELVKYSPCEVAVSRDIALNQEPSGIILVFYKMVNIGWITPGSTTISVQDSKNREVYEYLLGNLVSKPRFNQTPGGVRVFERGF